MTFLVQSTEVWTLAVSRLILASLVSTLAVLSLLSYRRERIPALRRAVVGFFCIAVGLVIEIIYAVLIKESFFLTELEIIRLQLVEGGFLIVGFLLLLYAVSGY